MEHWNNKLKGYVRRHNYNLREMLESIAMEWKQYEENDEEEQGDDIL